MRDVQYTLRKITVPSRITYEELMNQMKLEHMVANLSVLDKNYLIKSCSV